MTLRILRAASTVALSGVLLLAGCKISKQVSGEDKKVSIEAPGASVHVDTATTASDSGIPLYPGAVELPTTAHSRNGKRVDVSTLFGEVKVVKLQYTSEDAPQKILAFYQDKLRIYGAVLECRDEGVGPQSIFPGEHNANVPVACKPNGASGETSLKVGVVGDQHIVRVKPSGKVTAIELIYLRTGGSKNSERQPS